MSKQNLLLLSNSTNFGEAYLEYPKATIANFLGAEIKEILFIPFAGVGFSYDDYTSKVNEPMSSIGYKVKGIHTFENAQKAVEQAEAFAIGGGNTFELLNQLYEQDLIAAIREKVFNGTPLIGWSAGSNVTGPSIKTTNDMPIVEPASFDALNLVPFQVNPHYTEARLPNHGGETRKDRLNEFLALNPEMKVVGVPEGNLLEVKDSKMRLVGDGVVKVFEGVNNIRDFTKDDDLSFLLESK